AIDSAGASSVFPEVLFTLQAQPRGREALAPGERFRRCVSKLLITGAGVAVGDFNSDRVLDLVVAFRWDDHRRRRSRAGSCGTARFRRASPRQHRWHTE